MKSILAKYIEAVMPTDNSKAIALITLAATFIVAMMQGFIEAVFDIGKAQAYWITAVLVLLTLLTGTFFCIASIRRDIKTMFDDNKTLAEGVVARDKTIIEQQGTIAVNNAEKVIWDNVDRSFAQAVSKMNEALGNTTNHFTQTLTKISEEKEAFLVQATKEQQDLLRQIARHREEKEKLYDDNCRLANENREFKNKLLLMAQPSTSS